MAGLLGVRSTVQVAVGENPFCSQVLARLEQEKSFWSLPDLLGLHGKGKSWNPKPCSFRFLKHCPEATQTMVRRRLEMMMGGRHCLVGQHDLYMPGCRDDPSSSIDFVCRPDQVKLS